MADITITDIEFQGQVRSLSIQIGEAVPIYSVVYYSGGKYYKADATNATKANASYFTISAGDADGDWVQAIPLEELDELELTGPTLVVGEQYVVSGATAGKMAPEGDLTTGQFKTEIFTGKTASIAKFDLEVTGIAMP